MKIIEVSTYLESLAPRPYQESYDNAGLLTGSYDQEVTGILTTLDCTEDVVDEAIERKCNLIVAHHPIIFKGLKKITGSNYIERTILKAIKNDVAIYAIHTNLDNVLIGVNRKIADKIGLTNLKILAPTTDNLSKLVTFVPETNKGDVLNVLHEAGAGQIGNYKNCSFQVEGTGAFLPTDNANPHIGSQNELEMVKEVRMEVIFPTHLHTNIVQNLRMAHPYEEVAYYVTSLTNENQEVGSGMIGELDEPIEPMEFLNRLKVRMELNTIRYTRLSTKPVKKIAICGGSGSFLLSKAIQKGADVFITADFKYHEFFDADGRITIVDVGHYESEIFTKELLQEILTKKFPTFAVNFSRIVTNPVRYL
jgi:dinuclear metal center YbgI/SA1388 family protein